MFICNISGQLKAAANIFAVRSDKATTSKKLVGKAVFWQIAQNGAQISLGGNLEDWGALGR
jgi:hypothetical protein